ncbi:MAG: hypothetical protein O3B41_07885 [Bacteroidetes bacterium]|nr:hypothetical protein [Bacteroidota bacterium]
MKNVIAGLGVIAFLLVLLIKPFDLATVYSTHAGKMVQSITTNTSPISPTAAEIAKKDAGAGSEVLIGISKASTEASEFNSRIWIISLLMIAAVTMGASLRRKRKNRLLKNM